MRAVGSNLKSDPKITRHLKDLYPDLETLFMAGEDVDGLTGHPGWARVVELVEAEIARIDADLDGNSVPLTQAEYAMAHGRRGGLRFVLEAPATLAAVSLQRLEEQRAKHEHDAAAGVRG